MRMKVHAEQLFVILIIVVLLLSFVIVRLTG
nr:MAG TPA: Merozoite Surface Antigen 2 (MSA-2) family [Caudoviricetes sp.]